jgi:U3 small nucleolar RNA-associated protein 10
MQKAASSTLALKFVPGLFNVALHSAKQLRHFRFTICTYVSSLLSSTSFVNQVAALSDEATQEMEPLYQELIENVLTYIQAVNEQLDRREQQTTKYWTVMLGLVYDVLDKVLIFQ